MAGARTDPSPASVASLPLKSNFRDHPNAPTEFPKAWSIPEAPPPVKALGNCDIYASRGGYPDPVTSTEADGYRAELTPRNLMTFLAKGQQSTDLNPPERLPGLSEFDCHVPCSPVTTKRDGVTRFRQQISAATGTCSGRSALG